jgi:hypothetical protein
VAHVPRRLSPTVPIEPLSPSSRRGSRSENDRFQDARPDLDGPRVRPAPKPVPQPAFRQRSCRGFRYGPQVGHALGYARVSTT